ncbi:DMT family transporter [Streptomyces sp. NPDC059582]|uniref:DMT family transporter n=1 Tax=Streptomyces sp. NPDC059582 TaxID=3346875 RepID=UPI00368AB203
MNTRIGSRSFLALSAVVVLWASAFPAIRVGVDGLGVAALSLMRLSVAAAALLVIAPFLGVRRPRPRDLPLIALAGATGMTAYQVLLNWGEVHVPAGTASMLIAIAPVCSILLGRAFLSEPVTGRVVAGSGVAIGGCVLVALGGGSTGFSTGALVVLAAAVVQGVYHCVSKPLLRRYSGLEVATYAMAAGTALALPLLPATLHALAAAPSGALASAAYLGLLPSAVGFVLWGYAVARLPLTVSTAALYLVPPVAIVVSFVWLSEIPRLLEVVGGFVIISGVVLINRRSPAATREGHGPAAEPAKPHPTEPTAGPVAKPGVRLSRSAGPGRSRLSPPADVRTGSD